MQPQPLYNKINKNVLKQKLQSQIDADPNFTSNNVPVSFYKYFHVHNPTLLRNEIYNNFLPLHILGRIYVAHEGINAQFQIPKKLIPKLLQSFANNNASKEYQKLHQIQLKIAINVSPHRSPFYKLAVKVRQKLVGDGLPLHVDPTQIAPRLNPQQFNCLLNQPDSHVVDMRNHYETEIGFFQDATRFHASTFKEVILKTKQFLAPLHKKTHVALYCTGGIRCEKAGAYFKSLGYSNVSQLKDGIIGYVHAVKKYNLPNKFLGKNFVFDGRLSERVSNHILATCHQCNQPADSHTNCRNDACHLLFIQCSACTKFYQKCCSSVCQKIANLPIQLQRKLRKGKILKNPLQIHSPKKRFRPWIDPPLIPPPINP